MGSLLRQEITIFLCGIISHKAKFFKQPKGIINKLNTFHNFGLWMCVRILKNSLPLMQKKDEIVSPMVRNADKKE